MPAGKWVRALGSDIEAGATVLAAGERVGAAEIGILATVGAARVQVATFDSVPDHDFNSNPDPEKFGGTASPGFIDHQRSHQHCIPPSCKPVCLVLRDPSTRRLPVMQCAMALPLRAGSAKSGPRLRKLASWHCLFLSLAAVNWACLLRAGAPHAARGHPVDGGRAGAGGHGGPGAGPHPGRQPPHAPRRRCDAVMLRSLV